MNCAYSAGAIAALAKELNFTTPDVVVGSSGSITFTYYVSQQYDSIRNIWTNLLASKKFISLKRMYPIMDINYMVDVVFKKQDPLHVHKILKSKTKLFLSATNCQTGEAEYFSNDGKNDMFEMMRATTAVPLIFNKKVRLNGKYYVDGEISSSIGKNIKKAIDEGAKKIIVVRNSNNRKLSGSLFWKLCSFFTAKPIHNAIKDLLAGKHDSPIPKNIRVFNIEPSSLLTIHGIDNDRIHLEEAFNLGYNDVAKNKKLKGFLRND